MKKTIAILSISMIAASSAFAKKSSTNIEDSLKKKAKQHSLACNDESGLTVRKFTNKYRPSYETPTTPESEAHFYIVSCTSGAYNMSSILFYDNPYSGLVAISLAFPHFEEKSLKIIGWTADVITGDLSYDPNTKTLSSYSKGRGLGDMSVKATYAVLEDMVILRKYEYDGTDDLEINAKVVFESTESLKR